MKGDVTLHQFFTPAWAAELIVQKFYPDLRPGDVVLEPTCGDGRFLMAIPEDVEAYGIEIDPAMAQAARRNSGRDVIVGDIRTVALPKAPTLVLGNPPYDLDLVDAMLDRFYEEMDYGGKIGLLLPAYAFQTASRVVRYHERYSLDQAMVPRNLFEGMSKPLMFAQFKKERQPVFGGLFLYLETDAVQKIAKKYRTLFVGNESRASLWGELVERALINLGGEAHIDSIYREVEGKQPTSNRFWREQIRKILHLHYRRIAPSRYALDKSSEHEAGPAL